jgi:hypothetical protein
MSIARPLSLEGFNIIFQTRIDSDDSIDQFYVICQKKLTRQCFVAPTESSCCQVRG